MKFNLVHSILVCLGIREKTFKVREFSEAIFDPNFDLTEFTNKHNNSFTEESLTDSSDFESTESSEKSIEVLQNESIFDE